MDSINKIILYIAVGVVLGGIHPTLAILVVFAGIPIAIMSIVPDLGPSKQANKIVNQCEKEDHDELQERG